MSGDGRLAEMCIVAITLTGWQSIIVCYVHAVVFVMHLAAVFSA